MADVYSDEENVVPAVLVSKKVAAAKSKAGGKASAATAPLQPSAALNSNGNVAAGRTIEQTYQKKTPLEHVLLRPDTYVGSIEKHKQPLWVYEGGKMVQREITYVPGLHKIFDEILVNAADNKQRDPTMDCLKVDIDPEANTIRVWNNGKGVPVEIHAGENCYVPEMIFGNLLTSSNYDDTERKTTGGRNGYGAKLANIFSTEFVIETADGDRQRRYRQVFNDNMSRKSEPVIAKCKASENWTCVTFRPDLSKFRLARLEDDIVALMSKRVVDIAGCLGKTVKVELGGARLPVKSFSDYVGLYLDGGRTESDEPLPRIYEKVSDQWEVCMSLSEGQFQQVSFVNSIATIRGGTHVQLVTEQVVSALLEKARKKAGKAQAASIKPFQIRNHLWVFVNALVVNPAFDSQTKETLNTRASEFGSTCKLSDKFVDKVGKSGVIENVLSWAMTKQSKELKKTDGSGNRQRLTGIDKLDDANDAGGRHAADCTLILTEGDSAKTLAVSGLSVVGRDRYGVFPLRGKLLNVREASHKQIMENKEISHIKQIMGLQQGKEYNNAKSLRYGHLMIMTDQDHDGSHIKGLLVNFLHTFWPSLLKVPNFLLEFITPIVKATDARGKNTRSFYTLPEYEAWKDSLGGTAKGWTIKYYKGLGTSTPKEAKEYFAALEQHKKDFTWSGEQDGENIELAFSKKKIEARKAWLRAFEPGTFLDQSVSSINYTDFVNKELILFSLADNLRSIPSVMDGLKPGQRKILFCCFKRNLKSDIKVARMGRLLRMRARGKGEGKGKQSTAAALLLGGGPQQTLPAVKVGEELEALGRGEEGLTGEQKKERAREKLSEAVQRTPREEEQAQQSSIVAMYPPGRLLALGYTPMASGKKAKKGASHGTGGEAADDDNDNNDNDNETAEAEAKSAGGGKSGASEGAASKKGYDYLLGMPLWSLTLEKVQELCSERDGKEEQLEALKRTDPRQLWELDLANFLTALEAMDVEDEKEAVREAAQRKKAMGGPASKRAPAGNAKGKAKRFQSVEDSDSEGSGSDFEAPK
eukprot:jgi/Mesen1/6854/ME000351S05971